MRPSSSAVVAPSTPQHCCCVVASQAAAVWAATCACTPPQALCQCSGPHLNRLQRARGLCRCTRCVLVGQEGGGYRVGEGVKSSIRLGSLLVIPERLAGACGCSAGTLKSFAHCLLVPGCTHPNTPTHTHAWSPLQGVSMAVYSTAAANWTAGGYGAFISVPAVQPGLLGAISPDTSPGYMKQLMAEVPDASLVRGVCVEGGPDESVTACALITACLPPRQPTHGMSRACCCCCHTLLRWWCSRVTLAVGA